MKIQKTTSRRTVLKAGLTSIASAAVITPEGYAAFPKDVKPKAPGETKAVFLGGDILHNFMAQEPPLRRMCERMGMKFYSIHDSQRNKGSMDSTPMPLFLQVIQALSAMRYGIRWGTQSSGSWRAKSRATSTGSLTESPRALREARRNSRHTNRASPHSCRGTPGICPNHRPIGSMDSAGIKPRRSTGKLPRVTWRSWDMSNACLPCALRANPAGKRAHVERITNKLLAPSHIGPVFGTDYKGAWAPGRRATTF